MPSWQAVLQWLTFFAVLAAAVFTGIYAGITHRQWQVAQDTLQVSQRAYITIGKNDGVVSDVIIPSVPNQDAELVMYFQNSGHIPATFARGTMVAFAGAGSKKKSEITSTHPFTGLAPRTRNKKNGSMGGEGGTSLRVIPFLDLHWEKSRENTLLICLPMILVF